MSFSARNMNAPAYARYLVKTFGATVGDCQFSRLPTVIRKSDQLSEIMT